MTQIIVTMQTFQSNYYNYVPGSKTKLHGNQWNDRIWADKQKTKQQQNFWVNFTSKYLFLGSYLENMSQWNKRVNQNQVRLIIQEIEDPT